MNIEKDKRSKEKKDIKVQKIGMLEGAISSKTW